MSEPIQELASLLTLSTYGNDPLFDCDANSDEDLRMNERAASTSSRVRNVDDLFLQDDSPQYLDESFNFVEEDILIVSNLNTNTVAMNIEPSTITNESGTGGNQRIEVNKTQESSKKSNKNDSKEKVVAGKPNSWHYNPATLRQSLHPLLNTKRKPSKLALAQAKFLKMQEDWASELHELKMRQMTEKHATEMEVLSLARERAQHDVTTSRQRTEFLQKRILDQAERQAIQMEALRQGVNLEMKYSNDTMSQRAFVESQSNSDSEIDSNNDS